MIKDGSLESVLDLVAQVDVRLVCFLNDEKWYLDKIRVTRYYGDKNIPNCVVYPSYLFLRIDMSKKEFLELVTNMKLGISEMKINGYTIYCETLRLNESRRISGKNYWGVAKSDYPSWYFDGRLRNIEGLHSKYNGPLIGDNSPYFPTVRDGESWFLYQTIIDSNKTIPDVELSFDDNRAYFTGITIEGDKYTVSCSGEQLKHCKLELFTSNLQLVTKQAEEEQVFTVTGRPSIISFVLTAQGQWLDRRDIDLSNVSYFITDDINFTYKDDNLAVLDMIERSGEGLTLEFKERLDEKNNRLLQSIVAFSNTNGGYILLGVNDNGVIVGLNQNDTKERIQNKIEDCIDGYPKVEYKTVEIHNKKILVIKVEEAIEKPCALNVDSNKPMCYVRRDGSNKIAKPEDYRNMCKKTLLN